MGLGRVPPAYPRCGCTQWDFVGSDFGYGPADHLCPIPAQEPCVYKQPRALYTEQQSGCFFSLRSREKKQTNPLVKAAHITHITHC